MSTGLTDLDSGFQLVVLKGEDRGRSIPLHHREIHLGRKSSGAPQAYWIYFAEPTVSRHHATLVYDDTRRAYNIYHRSQTNPTLVNGKRVVQSALERDDVVQIGLLVFRLELTASAPVRRDQLPDFGPAIARPDEAAASPAPAEEAAELQTGLRLTVIEGPDQGRSFPLVSTVLFVGRRDSRGEKRATNGILLTDDELPREHLLLAWNEREQSYGIFQVESSTLATRVMRIEGGEARAMLLDPSQQLLLQPNDVLRFASTALRFELDRAEPASPPSRGTDLHATGRIPEEAMDEAGRRTPPRPKSFAETEGASPLISRRRRETPPQPPPADPPVAPPTLPRPAVPGADRPFTETAPLPPSLVRPASRTSIPLARATPAPPPETPPTVAPTVESPSEPAPAERPIASPDDTSVEADAPPAPPPPVPEPAPRPALPPLQLPKLDMNLVRNLPTQTTGDTPVTPPLRPSPKTARPSAPPPRLGVPSAAVVPPAPPTVPPVPAAPPTMVDAPAPAAVDAGPTAAVDATKGREPALPPPRDEAPSAAARADEADTVSRVRPRISPEGIVEEDDSAEVTPDALSDEEEAENLDFKDSTFSWRYRADYVLGFLEGPNRGQKIELLTRQLEDGRQIRVGSPGDRFNEIEVDDPAVANTQATITYAAGRFTLRNEGEAGQMAVNQIALGPDDEMILKTGDRITMGESVIIFLERSVVQVLSRFEVVVMGGIPEDLGRSFDLLREVVVVGRNRSCEIALADPEVSRKHMAIALRNGRFYLSHLSTSNPTFINGISLPRGRDRLLNDGDKIQVSDHTTLLFRERAPRR